MSILKIKKYFIYRTMSSRTYYMHKHFAYGVKYL